MIRDGNGPTDDNNSAGSDNVRDLITSSEGGDEEEVSGEVNLSTLDELMKAQDKDFLNELSLYTEFYKQQDYKSATPHWQKLYNKYPKSTMNLYIHGSKIYEHQIENAKTDAERDKYIDLYMKLYDKRMKHFDDRGNVLGRKGTSWLKYKLDPDRDNTPEGEAWTIKKGKIRG